MYVCFKEHAVADSDGKIESSSSKHLSSILWQNHRNTKQYWIDIFHWKLWNADKREIKLGLKLQ